ncbi:hypothetical protein JKG47_05540 [Acidithiobacillus sp. MC6.1]|nr:hypothetical protein [Acidithiobacillus sp. MC6.1]
MALCNHACTETLTGLGIITKREMLERLVVAEDDRITATLVNDDLWDAYHELPALRSNN